MKLVSIDIQDSVRTYSFEYQGTVEQVWFRSNQPIDPTTDHASAFLLWSMVFAMMDDGLLDLGNAVISKKVFLNVQKIAALYHEWFPELQLQELELYNYQSRRDCFNVNDDSVLAFTGGVDSLHALHTLTNNKECPTLLHIEGFDNHYQDVDIYKDIYRNLRQLEITYNLNQHITIATNIRDFTEKYIDWEKIHGLCLAGAVYTLETSPKIMYLSVNWTQAEDYNCGCQDTLNPLFSSEKTTFKDTGLETRISKIKALSQNTHLLPYIRVCWQNPSHRVNCGVCEKCIRTILALAAFLPKEQVYKLFDIHDVRSADVERLRILNDETYWFYKDIVEHLPDTYAQQRQILSKKLATYSAQISTEATLTPWPPQKKKAILFIDFNGVISYLPFWFSLADKTHALNHIHKPLEHFLFKENVHIIKQWMNGGYSSEEVHDLIHTGLGRNFSKQALWRVFVDDCKNIDVSKPIISHLNKIKDAYYVVLMTDNMDSFDRFTLTEQASLFSVFDEISNSYNEKRGKRDNGCASFFKYIDRYQANSSHCILLDDSNGNCQAFAECVGGRSVRVRTEDEVLEALQTLQTEHAHRWEWQY